MIEINHSSPYVGCLRNDGAFNFFGIPDTQILVLPDNHFLSKTLCRTYKVSHLLFSIQLDVSSWYVLKKSENAVFLSLQNPIDEFVEKSLYIWCKTCNVRVWQKENSDLLKTLCT